MPLQQGNRPGVDRHHPPTPLGLGCAHDASATNIRQLLHHEERFPLEVDVLPPKADGFASTQSGDKHQLVEHGKAVFGDVLEEARTFLGATRLRALRVLRCELDVLGRVVGDESGLHGGIER